MHPPGRVFCRDAMKCPMADCGRCHPAAWFDTHCPDGAECDTAECGKLHPRAWRHRVRPIEKLVLAMTDVDMVCLPRAAVELLLQRQDILKHRFGVTVEPVKRQHRAGTALQRSPGTGVTLRGAVGTLALARRALCHLSDEFTSRFAVHRLIVERCKLIFDSADELALANRLWSRRRVLLHATGELAVVREVRVEEAAGRPRTLTLTMEPPVDAAAATPGPWAVPAGQCVCWDHYGTPNAITLTTKPFDSLEDCQGTLQRLCGRIAPVEDVWMDTARVQSRVVFDISRDPNAPATALIALARTQVKGAPAQVRRLPCWCSLCCHGSCGCRG